jgi:hypothetical protein
MERSPCVFILKNSIVKGHVYINMCQNIEEEMKIINKYFLIEGELCYIHYYNNCLDVIDKLRVILQEKRHMNKDWYSISVEEGIETIRKIIYNNCKNKNRRVKSFKVDEMMIDKTVVSVEVGVQTDRVNYLYEYFTLFIFFFKHKYMRFKHSLHI